MFRDEALGGHPRPRTTNLLAVLHDHVYFIHCILANSDFEDIDYVVVS